MENFSMKSSLFLAIILCSLFHFINAKEFASFGPLVTKEGRRTIVSTECGAISAVDVHDGYSEGTYHLEFITLDTSSLFLPVILHRDMVFYVHSGSGTVNWVGEDGGTNHIEVKRGDIYRLEEGAIFYALSHPDSTREKLRIHAIFNTILDEKPSETFVGAYSNVRDLIRGFDDEILKMAFGVSDEVIQGIKRAEKPPQIVRFERKNETDEVDWREGIFEALIGGRLFGSLNGKKKKKEKSTKPFNIFDTKPDIENCNGWSTAVTSKKFRPLKDSDIGMFIVNLTKGSMMGPHWNPKATEIAMVTHGQGMVQIICPSNPSGMGNEAFHCQNTNIKVDKGDIFIVPRYHPMVQVSFNYDSLVFVGFSTMANENNPQFLAGKRSVLQTIDREILAISFNTANTTIDRFLGSQEESIMFECASCAEQLEKKMEELAEKQRKEEEAKKEEEEAHKREEEEARRREEEKEARRRHEEEKKREEEEAKKKEEEEARKKEEEEARRKEEDKREQEEEEAKKKKEEEEARKKEEEEEKARKREEEEEEVRRKVEEEARRKEEEREQEEEEARKRKEQEREKKEEEARKREEEVQRGEEEKEEEEARRQAEEEEEKTRREEEKEARREEKEEEGRREEEEAMREEKEEAQRKQEEKKGKQKSKEEEKQDVEKPAFI